MLYTIYISVVSDKHELWLWSISPYFCVGVYLRFLPFSGGGGAFRTMQSLMEEHV